MIPRTNRRWTTADFGFVKRHLPYTSKGSIAASLGVTVGALDWMVRTHGLKTDAEDLLVTEIKQHIANIRKELEL